MRGPKFRYVRAFCLCVSIIIGVAACSTTMYGVPEDQWNKMTDMQKQTAIEGYNERQRLREIERQKEAERDAREARVRAEEGRQREEIRKKRIEAIYRGVEGQYGDLIRVSIQGGEMRIAGRRRDYQPVSFKIADGELKTIRVIQGEGRYGTYADLNVLYQDGVLYLDTYGSDVRGALRIVYARGWEKGKTYPGVNSESRLEFRNIRIFVEIIPRLLRDGF
jgi:hypothetical protein